MPGTRPGVRRVAFASSVATLLTFVPPAHAGPQAAEFPLLADTPYPAQHVNPRASDFVAEVAPVEIEKVWETLTEATVAQPCSSGRGGRIYCTLGWDADRDECNLRALDATTGAQIWEDRVDGHCLLDGAALLINPLIDVDGNLYVADSRQIASFTRDGQLRWTNPVPGELVSPQGFPNPPFGLNMLPSGDLVTATIGDGFVLVLDRATGTLRAPPFDLPSRKHGSGGSRPPGFMSDLAGAPAADLLWAIALGGSSYEVDNNVAVDSQTGLVFITGGAPAPNDENHGALWALEVDGDAISVAFYAEFAGQGGIATTPSVTADGRYVVIGDNQENLVAVDVRACAALPPGSRCDTRATVPLGEQLGASVVITPDDRVVFPQPSAGLRAFDLATDAAGGVVLREAWTLPFPGETASSVATGFENVVYVAASRVATGEHALVAVDLATGREIARHPSGDFANLTMSSDPGWLLTNNINFTEELSGRHRPAGVFGWRAVESAGGRCRVARRGSPPPGRAPRALCPPGRGLARRMPRR